MNIEELNKKRAEVAKARARFEKKNIARAAKESEADRKAEARRLDQELAQIDRAEKLQAKASEQGGRQRNESPDDQVQRLLKAAKQSVNRTGDEGVPNAPAPADRTTPSSSNGGAAKSEEK